MSWSNSLSFRADHRGICLFFWRSYPLVVNWISTWSDFQILIILKIFEYVFKVFRKICNYSPSTGFSTKMKYTIIIRSTMWRFWLHPFSSINFCLATNLPTTSVYYQDLHNFILKQKSKITEVIAKKFVWQKFEK